MGFGLPRADEGSRLLPRGAYGMRLAVAAASHAHREERGNETLLVDGDTTRWSLTVNYGVTERLQLGVELPYVLHESGGLDGVIDTWHGWFGLPDGIRDELPRDDLNLAYADATGQPLLVDRNQRGLGDLRLLAAWGLPAPPGKSRAIRASLKLPTGDSARLTGSGGTDLAMGYAVDYARLNEHPRWSAFWRADLVVLGEPDRLGERARPLIGVLAGGVARRVTDRLELAAQATLRSSAYDSDLRMTGEPAVLLNVGGTIDLTETLRLAIAVGEDVRVHSAPDVTFALTLRYAPATP